MYSKDELSSKNLSELEDIAKTAGIDVDNSKTQEEIIYAILDKQAEVEGNKTRWEQKAQNKNTEKDTDRVYSVNGKDGENFDLKKIRQWQNNSHYSRRARLSRRHQAHQRMLRKQHRHRQQSDAEGKA